MPECPLHLVLLVGFCAASILLPGSNLALYHLQPSFAVPPIELRFSLLAVFGPLYAAGGPMALVQGSIRKSPLKGSDVVLG